MNTHSKFDETFKAITDCFTGADGGIEFIRLKVFMEEIKNRANNGDQAAHKVLDVVYQFERLIRVANNA